MNPRTLWRLCALAGLLVAILSIILLPMFPRTGAENLSGYGGPVFAFEAARTSADILAVFGTEQDPGQALRIAQMDRGNYWDFLFMALYALFSGLFFLAIYAQSKKKVWLVFAGFGFLSGAMDAWENCILLAITADLDSLPFLDILPIPVWGKFFSIAAAIIGAGLYLFKFPKPIWKILGVVAIIGAFSVPFAFANPAEHGWLLQKGVAASWIIMSLHAYTRSVDRLGS